MKDQWLSVANLAERYGVSEQTVYTWNHTGTGPPAYKIGRHVRYRESEVAAWEQSRKVRDTTSPAA